MGSTLEHSDHLEPLWGHFVALWVAFGLTLEHFGDTLNPFGSTLVSLWTTLDHFRSTLDHFGSTLGSVCTTLGSLWKTLGRSWRHVEVTLGTFGPLWGRFWVCEDDFCFIFGHFQKIHIFPMKINDFVHLFSQFGVPGTPLWYHSGAPYK